MMIAEFILWGSLGTLFYIFLGYPLTILALGKMVPKPHQQDSSLYPMVTLVISAYNEEAIIRKKLDNTLELEYPRDKLEVIVISDESSDRTDAIVKEYQDRGIVLRRMDQRGGKTVGLNMVVPSVGGEIVVFSDANALYFPDVLRKLVRNFSDPVIGCVTGDSQYVDVESSGVSQSEKTYWDYDRQLKISESQLGSMVGSDGAIMAIRKKLFSPLEREDINDFVLPLQIVSQGYRCIFEPAAICEESSTTKMNQEFRRKVRVVNRSWTGLWRVKCLLNPFRYGLFTIQVLCHKLLRWLTPLILAAMLGASVAASSENHVYAWIAGLQIVGYGLGILGLVCQRWNWQIPLLSFGAYFLMVNAASVIGVGKAILGERIVIWEPERDPPKEKQSSWGRIRRLLGLSFAGIIGCVAMVIWPQVAFWSGVGILLYTYLGYPLLLMVLSTFCHKPWVTNEAYLPSVTLLIVACNEEEILEAKIQNGLGLDYPPDKLDIVVVSDGSTDGTNNILAKYDGKGIQAVVRGTRSGKLSAMNRIIPDCSSEIILVSDANVLYSKDAVKQIVKNFADPQVGAVSGEVRLISETSGFGPPEAMYYRYEWFIKLRESQLWTQIGADGAMYAFRKELFFAPSESVVVDDLVVVMEIAKAGKRVITDPLAKGFEGSADSLSVEFWRHARIAAGGIQSFLAGEGVPTFHQPLLVVKYWSHKLLRWLGAFVLIGVFIANSFLLDSLMYQWIFAVQVVFYLTALLGLVGKGRHAIFTVPLYVCTINFACAWGTIRGICNKQAAVWDKLGRVRVEQMSS